jgi:DNA-binding MarR family transcriptional regulator
MIAAAPSDRRLKALRTTLQLVHDQLSLPQLLLLLAVAERPGLSVNELADITALSQPVASRTLGALMGRYETQPGQEPVALVEQGINSEDPRRRALFLSAAGAKLVAELSKSIAS